MLRRFISYYGPYRGLLYLDLGTAAVRSILVTAMPLLITRMLQLYVPPKNTKMILFSLGGLCVLALGIGICSYINTKWGHILGARMETDMRADLFGHLQKLSFRYFDNTKTGHIMSRIANDLFTISEIAHHGPEDLLISFVLMIGAFVVLAIFDPVMAAAAVLPMPFMAGWGAFYRVRMKRGYRQVRQRIADINSNVENSIQGIREVKSFTNEDYEIDRFDGVNTEFCRSKEIMYSAMGGFHSGLTFFTEMYPIVVIGVGTARLYSGSIGIPVLVGSLLYVKAVMRPVSRLISFAELYQQGAAAFERFVEVMDLEPEITDRPHAICPRDIRGDIKIEDLYFKYDESDEDWIINGVNMTVPAGSKVALVGESGAGKTTIASLIPRFYEANDGRILIDGKDILDLKQRCLRSNIGIVQQNVFLFDTTVRDNIMFGNPDATEEELVDAAKKANIYDFIRSLPAGFDTVVGEHGIKLSGGQKQRVSVARVFLKKPRIVIFDEATSSLDNESEQLIQESMDMLSRNVTTLIIAHRLSTVRDADHMYVLRAGKVVEQGKHNELVEAGGYYAQLYEKSLF